MLDVAKTRLIYPCSINPSNTWNGSQPSTGPKVHLRYACRWKFYLSEFDQTICLQCFDAVGWAAGRAPGL